MEKNENVLTNDEENDKENDVPVVWFRGDKRIQYTPIHSGRSLDVGEILRICLGGKLSQCQRIKNKPYRVTETATLLCDRVKSNCDIPMIWMQMIRPEQFTRNV